MNQYDLVVNSLNTADMVQMFIDFGDGKLDTTIHWLEPKGSMWEWAEQNGIPTKGDPKRFFILAETPDQSMLLRLRWYGFANGRREGV